MKKPTFLLILILLSACSKESSSDYPYASGLEWFLQEEYNMNLASLNNEELLFVNVSCDDCMLSKLDILERKEFTKDLKIFFLGDTTYSQIVRNYQNNNSFFDLNSSFYDYETGISSAPLLLKIEDGIIRKHLFLSDNNQEEVITFLSTDSQ